MAVVQNKVKSLETVSPEECDLKPNNKADIHWANMTGNYTRDKEDYKPLCRWCHLKHDGNDIKSNGGRRGKDTLTTQGIQ